MQKNIFLILSILTTSHIHTMDEPMEIEKNKSLQPLICDFAMLDHNIWDLIAQYLNFPDIESEEEFIERTKIKITKAPKPYDKHLPRNEWGSGSNGTLVGYCPNNTKVALLRLLCGTGATPAFMIIDEKNDQALYHKPLDHKGYQHIALSRCATIFATIHEDREIDNTPRRGEKMCYIITNYLTIKNISTQTTETIELPGSFRTKSLLAFNKQGTHIILHGMDYTQTNSLTADDIKKDPMPHHLIFPVTVAEPNTIQPKKTLQNYFQLKGICKSIVSSINK